ncbi:hypothetical protein H920_15568 [Fukomys damarensis]|uniref:Uncharacterized protein n=1 Tax=Fukomys damarensis TaxID=885580 RepID=A0A091CWJ9_FUKDA|nr:hypothetical protein H920_15568 [Fukomys damarensis]
MTLGLVLRSVALEAGQHCYPSMRKSPQRPDQTRLCACRPQTSQENKQGGEVQPDDLAVTANLELS